MSFEWFWITNTSNVIAESDRFTYLIFVAAVYTKYFISLFFIITSMFKMAKAYTKSISVC